MEVKGKWIVVDDDVYQRLKGSGKSGETFSDIIRRLLETYELQASLKKEPILSLMQPPPISEDTAPSTEQDKQAA